MEKTTITTKGMKGLEQDVERGEWKANGDPRATPKEDLRHLEMSKRCQKRERIQE